MAQGAAPRTNARAARPSWQWVRVLASSLIALSLLMLVAAGGLWWWAGTDGSLSTGLRWAATHQPFNFEEARGSLRQGGQIKKLVWQQDGITVEADDVTLEWQPLALLQRTLQINRLTASNLRVNDERPPSATPTLPPNALGLPINIALKNFSIAQLQWAGPPALQATQLAGHYVYTGQQHQLQLKGVQFASGRYQGQATLAAAQPLTLDAVFSGTVDTPVPGTANTLPLTFDASAKGPLTDLAVKAALQVQQAPVNTTLPARKLAAPTLTTSKTPQATASAQIMPWADQPVRQADARFSALNLAALWPDAPQTLLTGSASVQPDNAGTDTGSVWLLQTQMANAVAGPWDKQRLPINTLQADGEWRGGAAVVRRLKARIGGGEVLVSGQWANAAAQDWTVEATLQRINAAALHSQLAALPLSGKVTARSMASKLGASIGFDVKLQAAAAKAAGKQAQNQAANQTADQVATKVANPLQLRDVAATGSWTAAQNNLTLPALRIRTDDAELSGSLDAQLPARGGNANLVLSAPGLNAQLQGELRPTSGAGAVSIQAKDAAQALRWLQRLPGVQGSILQTASAGRASLTLNWQGGWQDPSLQAKLEAPVVDITALNRSGAATTATQSILKFRNLEATLNGKLSQAQIAINGQLEADGRRYALRLAADGGRVGAVNPKDFGSLAASSWQAVVKQVSASVEDPALVAGAWRLTMLNNVTVRWDAAVKGGRVALMSVGAGELVLAAPTRAASPSLPARVQWQPIAWRGGELSSTGKVTGLPMAWAELFAGPQMAGVGLSGNLVFDGSWDALLGDTLRVKASLARSSGDITLQGETADGSSAKVSAGVRQASLTLETSPDGKGDTLLLALRWDSERAGTVDATLSTRLVKSIEGGWAWPLDAPLRGQLRAQLPRIGVWSVLAPPGWRLRGTLGANVAIGGTRAAPQLTGDVEANDLALRSVADGIEFGNGRLRAQLDATQGTRMKISEFYLQGVSSLDKKTPGGSLSAEGEAAWVDGKPQVLLNARLDKLRSSLRTDRQITLSGELTARLDGALAQLTGKLLVDQALILLPEESTPRLGDDVVVRGAGSPTGDRNANGRPAQATLATPPTAPSPGTQPRNLKVAVQIDLGQDFRVQGKGLDTRVAGVLTLTGDSPVIAGQPIFAPRLAGTVNTVGGQYRAYGQRLDVEQGTLRFTGSLDNPSLNILAIRPTTSRADQRVGVQIQGNALAPRVRLYAEPDLPDAEKLSWLVLGRPSATGGAEAALLQQAALALLGSKNNSSGGMSGGLAAAIGLDELSYRSAANNADGSTSEGAIILGKRFSRNFYVAYERSVSGALGTLFVFFDLSQRVTVRGQAGEQSAVDLIYTFSFDGKR